MTVVVIEGFKMVYIGNNNRIFLISCRFFLQFGNATGEGSAVGKPCQWIDVGDPF